MPSSSASQSPSAASRATVASTGIAPFALDAILPDRVLLAHR